MGERKIRNMTLLEEWTNQIICGDCLELTKQLPDGCVDLVVTDPPYNEVNRETQGLRIIDKGDSDSLPFVISLVLPEMIRLVNGSIYIFCGTEQVSLIRSFLVSSGLSTRHGYWEKENPSPMNGDKLWLSATENIIYAKKPGATFNAFCRKPIWKAPIIKKPLHPTQKPTQIISDMILVSSNPNDLVADFYMGSGTTLVAAKQLGRRFIGFEINPEYCKIAERRLAQEVLDFK